MTEGVALGPAHTEVWFTYLGMVLTNYLSMMIWGMVYYCYAHITKSSELLGYLLLAIGPQNGQPG